jgi:hypothetical protein
MKPEDILHETMEMWFTRCLQKTISTDCLVKTEVTRNSVQLDGVFITPLPPEEQEDLTDALAESLNRMSISMSFPTKSMSIVKESSVRVSIDRTE